MSGTAWQVGPDQWPNDPTGIDIALLKRKSLSPHWELMFKHRC